MWGEKVRDSSRRLTYANNDPVTDELHSSEPETPNPERFLTPGRFAVVLAVLLAITFWRVLFGGEAFFYRDYGFLGYPFAHFHRECFWSGDFFPLWNPYVNCGAPFLAQWNTLCLYPGSLIYLLLPLPWSLGFFCVVHLFLGGMGMRALAERWTGSPFGAGVAGVAFVFSGLVLGCVIYPNYLVALGWMPWVVLAVRRAWLEGGRWLVIAALVGAMQMLTGAPEIILLTWGLMAMLLVVDWVQRPKSKVQSRSAQGRGETEHAPFPLTPALSPEERGGGGASSGVTGASLAGATASPLGPKSEAHETAPAPTASPRLPGGVGRGEGERRQSEPPSSPSVQCPTNHYLLITRFCSVIALITGLCAAQLLPFFQLLALSQRSGDAVNTFWSRRGWGWVNLFFPLFMNFQTEQGVFVMIGQSFFPSVYLGIVPLTLAGLAVWGIGLRRGAGVMRAETGGEFVATLPPHPGPLPPGEGERQSALGDAAAPCPAAVWEVRLLGAATLLAVLLAMGDNFPLWGWLRAVLPLGVMRFPVKSLLLAGFTVPLLAGFGAAFVWARARQVLQAEFSVAEGDSRDAILKRFSRSGFWKGWLVVLGVVTALLAVSYLVAVRFPLVKLDPQAALECVELRTGVLWWGAVAFIGVAFAFGQRMVAGASVLLVGVMALDGAFHCGVLNPTISASAFEPGAIAAYHAQKGALTPAPKLGESRMMLSPQAERALHTRMVPKFYDDFIGQRLAFWGNLNLLDGLPKVNGASTLVAREWNDVEYFLYGTTNPAPANLMDFLGVTHTTKAGELMQWERRETAMPMVSVGQKVQSYDDGSQSVGALLGENWNPREMILIAASALTNRVDRASATARVRHFQPRASGMQPASVSDDSNGRRLQAAGTDAGASGMIEVEAEAAAPTVLVLAQNFYPGWRATVNGQPAPVLRANHAFQAIAIPAGKSTIRLDYVDWPFRFGVGISLLTLAGCGVLWRRAKQT